MKLLTETNAGKLLIKCEDEEEGEPHPHCAHGPTLLFYYEDKSPREGYYACSAYRDKKLCSFNLPAKELTTKHLSRVYDVSTLQFRNLREKFLDSTYESQKHYCLTCNEPLKESDLQPHLKHEVKRNLATRLIKNPTTFLTPLDNDKAQAQYFFDDKALQFFENCFNDLKVTKVICIGAPRLHAHLQNMCSANIKSFLLDFDYRFYYFYNDQEYAWYNMCNNYFFDELQKQEFFRFLKCKSNDRILIFTDPPFGCRTEPVAATLHKLTKLYNRINQLPYQPLPIFWIFPYFSAHYIQQQMPALQMSDYKINYTNHTSYTDMGNKSRKLGSPVRIFTNVPLQLLKLPIQEQYKYCSKCEKYTALENRHCEKCNSCPSKNGATYKHCDLCGLCVKPYYVHCNNCRRCTQLESHNCLEYQQKQKCWICREVGHTEHKCSYWQKKMKCSNIFPRYSLNAKETEIVCLLCKVKGHNEQMCERRDKYLKEFTFMSETQLMEKI
ncbi:rRNA N6-adenosine-methyltransferase ZCCHC4 [Lucilia sericata]|uniref:rRNA N6-adenosine-methyltransferase ZCCHC4 n=1 Tax=Lucilia sericata TaxID=13632 RepID=UPI0018A827C8|nr:rRNA N6-adenosine-methyltransferase ZCCHC4 [Lucilia sericata]